ncbi:hypothetical protein MHBO_002202 [Bonamia ostreae]|uniref:Uncharacterized protein n=1 Tax=Bonamia ostreae TaxID=126728 RepID=A0ABV2ALM1_9EUKA
MDFLNELRFQPLSFSTRDQESVLLRLSLFKSKFEPKTIFNASQTSDPAMPLSVRFAHKMNSNDIFCLSGESGSLRIYKNENVELVEAHDNAVFDVRWLDEDKKILTVIHSIKN